MQTWFHNLMFIIFGDLPLTDCHHHISDEIVNELKKDFNEMKYYLLSHLPILSCNDQSLKDNYVKLFTDAINGKANS
jgi:hypothetical protein